jgi:membrane protease YdiL (CAAX protease family)
MGCYRYIVSRKKKKGKVLSHTPRLRTKILTQQIVNTDGHEQQDEKTFTEESNQNGKNPDLKLSEKWIYAAGLTIVFGVEFVLRDLLLPENANDIGIDLALIGEWVTLSFLVFLWIPQVEKKNMASIGLGKFKRRHLGWAVLVYILALVASSISGFVLQSVGLPSLRSLQPMIKGYGFATLFGLFLTGTFLEEVFYRGYLIERMTTLTRNRWVAAFVSWLLFTLVHLKFFGLGATIDTTVVSAALVLLYMKEKSIWPCIIVHGINDALALLIFPLLI